MRECIFCGATSDITREHIWADWLKEYIAKDIDGYQAATITINQPSVASTVREKKISGDPRSRKAKCVCGSCNNGWMSQLQERAKPLVLSLIEGCQIEGQMRIAQRVDSDVGYVFRVFRSQPRSHPTARSETPL
jgi:hypothetical protein